MEGWAGLAVSPGVLPMKLRVLALCLALAALGASPAAAATPGFFVGVVEEPDNVGPAGSHFGQLGLGAVKVWVEWQPGQSAPDAGQTGILANALASVPPGTRVVAAVGSSGTNAPTDAARRAEYCTFVRELLRPFPRIQDVVIWNEPNKTANWDPQFNEDGTSAAPAAYVALLAQCWDVLHAFRPSVNVVGPATSPRGNDRPNAVTNISHSPTLFLLKMGEAYRASGRQQRIFDTFAHHAYGSQPGERPWRSHGTTQISQGDHQKLMSILRNAFGGTGQAVPGECRPGGCVWIWYAEFGYQTEPDEAKRALYSGEENFIPIPDFVGGEPDAPPTATNAPDHWTQIVDGIRLAYCQPYVQGVFNFKLVDHAHLDGWQSGFLWADWTEKDSYPALRQVVGETRSQSVDCSRLKGGPVPGVDTFAPPRPSLPPARVMNRRLRLDWPDPPAADVMGYRVYRATRRRGPYRLLTPALLSASAYLDRRVRNGRAYCYFVTAIDSSENQSPRSRARCARPRRR